MSRVTKEERDQLRREWSDCSEVNEGRAIVSLLNDIDDVDAEIEVLEATSRELAHLVTMHSDERARLEAENAALRKCARALMRCVANGELPDDNDMALLREVGILDENNIINEEE